MKIHNSTSGTVIFLLLAGALQTVAQDRTIVVEDWEQRLNRRQPPMKVMDAIGLESGMTIADIGAGRGRYAVWLADRVGPEGRVIANDIDGESLAHLAARCEAQGFTNVTTVLGEVTDPKLPRGEVDIAFMINVYHHLADPLALIRRTIPCLKPGGYIAIVECDPDKQGTDRHHGTPREKMLRQLEQAGLETIKILDPDFLKQDTIYICRPRLP